MKLNDYLIMITYLGVEPHFNSMNLAKFTKDKDAEVLPVIQSSMIAVADLSKLKQGEKGYGMFLVSNYFDSLLLERNEDKEKLIDDYTSIAPMFVDNTCYHSSQIREDILAALTGLKNSENSTELG